MAEDLLANVSGWVLADRSYGSARLATQLADQGGWLLAHPGAPDLRGRGHHRG
jgi:hypothetical protein